ncbi:hypothetical protein [Streptomyces sp. L2]|uniref:hypothetical protein n=1 Tax=Streptomyces sp. L2 TaxID=2162665 RepID=UPI0013E92E2A|nr:hypothetical protein [Streptomyces sp. L2]
MGTMSATTVDGNGSRLRGRVHALAVGWAGGALWRGNRSKGVWEALRGRFERETLRIAVVVTVLAASWVVGIALCVVQAVGPYRDLAAYRHARPCSVGRGGQTDGAACLGRETAAIDSWYAVSSDDGTDYTVTIRRGEGEASHTEKHHVSKSLYTSIGRHDARIALTTWHGHVVALELHGHRSTETVPSSGPVVRWLVLGWVLFGLPPIVVLLLNRGGGCAVMVFAGLVWTILGAGIVLLITP